MSISEPANRPLQFAYWVPNVSGGLVISNIPQRTSWDIDYNRKLAQIAERAGFDYALTQIRFTVSYGPTTSMSRSLFPALLASTEKLKVIAALLPGPGIPPWRQNKLLLSVTCTARASRLISSAVGSVESLKPSANPGSTTKSATCVQKSSSVVCRASGGKTALPLPAISIAFAIIPQAQAAGGAAEIFQGGSSRAARDMAARVSDWYFTNGNTPEGIKAQVDDIQRKAAQNQHQVKIGVNGFVIARESEKEAQAVLREIIDNANPEAVKGFQHEVKNAGSASPEEGNWAKSTFDDLVQYNDGFKTNLIGTPQQIAERIIALKHSGVNLLLLAFLHFQRKSSFSEGK
jgi:FMNH2-dependent dimethyl sulfone monooxygenase